MTKINYTKIYGSIGKALCGIAGGIVGFVIGGIFLALAGSLIGIITGNLLERKVSKA